MFLFRLSVPYSDVLTPCGMQINMHLAMGTVGLAAGTTLVRASLHLCSEPYLALGCCQFADPCLCFVWLQINAFGMNLPSGIINAQPSTFWTVVASSVALSR